MPNLYTAPTYAIIVKSDGTETTQMAQAQTESYLKNMVEANRQANVTQAMNQTFNGQGKATGTYTYDAHAVYHSSAGNLQHCVCVFFIADGAVVRIIAMGEHTSSSSYKLSDYGQPAGAFRNGATITL